jgi:prevent-host-death family protein
MKTVGVRELKNRLSEYLREVRTGESVLVTDRGEVVAELSAPGASSSASTVPAGLAALARRGLATLGAPNQPELYPAQRAVSGLRSAGELLDDVRGTR